MGVWSVDKCGICGGHKTWLDTNVGWNIDGDGEEEQHIQHCECGALRNVSDVLDFTNIEMGKQRTYGKWFRLETDYDTIWEGQ